VQIDFAGSSPQQNIGINSTMVYTHVWAAYAMKCLLCPTLPNNEGTFAPLRVTAPEGCFLNPVYPAPVRLKSSSGHFIPDAIVHALESALSQRLLAESGNKFVVLFSGAQDNGRRFSESMFIMGGMGARLNKPGLDCRSFPANSSNLPVEVLEASVPVLVHRKRIRHGSGGDGAWRGGNGQDFTFESLSAAPMTVRASHGKLTIPPQGLRGGGNGQTGSIALNGEDVPDKTPMTVRKGDIVTLSTPGAGGMGKPAPQKEQGK
jgi:N-methylhydantoinase B/oxoprolinase/acetone carboxylase alpha subunit